MGAKELAVASEGGHCGDHGVPSAKHHVDSTSQAFSRGQSQSSHDQLGAYGLGDAPMARSRESHCNSSHFSRQCSSRLHEQPWWSGDDNSSLSSSDSLS